MTDDVHTLSSDLSLASRLEAVLFVSGDPVRVTRLSKTLGVTSDEVHAAIARLQADYAAGRGLMVVINDDTVQLATAPAAQQTIDALTATTLHEDLSKAALEVLAIVAYRSPVTRAEIEAIRGVNCSFSLRNLLLRGLVERIPDPARPRAYLYTVSNDFLTHLGITSSRELPDFDELSQHPSILQASGDALADDEQA